MEKSLSSVIQYIVKRFGVEILKDESRFWAIFLDLSPEMGRERKMIRRICDEHMLSRFLVITLASENEYSSIVSSLKSELTINQGFSDLWVDELVDAFCEALGIEYNNSEDVYRTEDSRSEMAKNIKHDRLEIILSFPREKKVDAIRYYREKYDCKLSEAKSFVDSIWPEKDNSWKTGVKKEGVLKWFNDERGYGVITGKDGTEILVFLEDFDKDAGFNVEEGDEVTYVETTTPNQCRYATHIRPKIQID